MDFIREGGSVSRPPQLDGTNYPYWKASMRAFIKALDEKAWCAILTGWTHSTKTDDNGNTIPKPVGQQIRIAFQITTRSC